MLTYSRYAIDHGSTLYIALDPTLPPIYEGVSILVHNPSNETGYCGSTLELPLLNGTTDLVRGPWMWNPTGLREQYPAIWRAVVAARNATAA